MKTFLTVSFICIVVNLHAQLNNVIGEYYLNGVMETASGFRFNGDSTFDFFFSQGAVDREGSGTWKLDGNRLILNGPPRADKDFILIRSEKTKSKTITIKISDANEMILRYVLCDVKTDTGIVQKQADEKGVITIAKQPVQSISLLHLLWPDRFSFFAIDDPDENDFEFSIDPNIVKVYFKDVVLTITDDGLIGQHPLMEGDQFTYEKNK